MNRQKLTFNEMAFDIGGNVTTLNNSKVRKNLYNKSKDHPVHLDLGNGIAVHKKTEDEFTAYHTLNHKTGECIHYAKFKEFHEKPFSHEVQFEVDQHKGNKDLPAGHARHITLDHMEHSSLPLRSDEIQSTEGHQMWRKMCKTALKCGYHVYHWDNGLHKSNEGNIEDHLNASHGNKLADHYKHMVISNKELK